MKYNVDQSKIDEPLVELDIRASYTMRCGCKDEVRAMTAPDNTLGMDATWQMLLLGIQRKRTAHQCPKEQR